MATMTKTDSTKCYCGSLPRSIYADATSPGPRCDFCTGARKANTCDDCRHNVGESCRHPSVALVNMRVLLPSSRTCEDHL
jgi:hypothetical protein